MFINFAKCDEEARFKMRMHNAAGYALLIDAETRTAPVWFLKSRFPGCLDHMEAEKPRGQGQIIVVPEPT